MRREERARADGANSSARATLFGDAVIVMMRFLFGALVGGALMYWHLTGEIPWQDQAVAWFSRTASSYTAEGRRGEADRLIDEARPARPAR